jgi:UDP-2,4-diacetamido-2,4,6-trideoxy-beta-L-altropyranose hydrolase
MKKIGLIFDSSYKIGGGHFWRCYNLAKILKKKGRNFFFISNKLKKNFINILRKEGFNYIKLKSLKKTSNIKSLIKTKQLDTFISDYYDLDEKNKKEINKIVNCFIVIDDHLNKKHFCDVYINNNFMTDVSKNRIKKLNPNSTLLLGIKYFIHTYKFSTLKKKEKNKNEIKKVFAFFGSSDPSNETFKFIKSVQDFKNIKFKILIGKLNKNYQKIKHYCKVKKNIRLFYNLTNYKTLKLMQNNDLSFGSGGINLTERLFLGLPSVVLCTAENQKNALIALKNKKIIYFLGDSKNVSVLLIKNCLKSFIKNKKLLHYLLKKTHQYYIKKNNYLFLQKRLNFIIKKIYK